ncbi:MAG: dipeptide epimerase [Alphaproteobacteria bacterium]|nr:dipeptide epimerase [Alphaproteobacteria bacterium]
MIEGRARVEEWPLKIPFVISRSSRTHVDVVEVTISDGTFFGRGECQPNSRYGETSAAVCAELRHFFDAHDHFTRNDITSLESKAAQNALDCALWDLRSKCGGQRVWEVLGQKAPKPFPTVFTLSLGAPEAMADAARLAWADGKRQLKLKLGGEGDVLRVQAVRKAVPDAVLVADANEAWDMPMLRSCLPAMAGEGIALLEQPLPAGKDAGLLDIDSPVPLCADESCHASSDVEGLVNKYQFVNIKLDKTGGLTEALKLETAARQAGMDIMVGCMLGTSLAMAPACLIASRADYVDLDGPLLLSDDRDHKLSYSEDYNILPFGAELWG